MAFFSPGGWSLGRRAREKASTRRLGVLVVTFALLASACGTTRNAVAASSESDLVITAEPESDSLARDLGAAGPAEVESPATTTTVAPTTTIAPAAVVDQDVVEVEAVTTWIATATDAVTSLVAYDSPGGSVIPFEFNVPNPHQFGGPQVLMVTEGTPDDAWVQVQLPIRPNGQTGWIDASLYEFSQTQIRAEVDLSARSIIVYDGTEIIAQTQAVIGSSTTPTPLGTYFITAKRRNPPEESYIGPWALALSAFSEVYDTFGGGLPVIAIHGTNRPDQVGEARSNGCLRIPNDVVTLLAELVPLGAPVTISA